MQSMVLGSLRVSTFAHPRAPLGLQHRCLVPGGLASHLSKGNVQERKVQERRAVVVCTQVVSNAGSPGSSDNSIVPVVKIDNIHDPFATVVYIKLGNVLEDLLDTVSALKNLGLNIKTAKLNPSDPDASHKFFVTDATTSEKIVKSERLETIRFTILENMAKYHPESISQLNVAHQVNLPDSRDSTRPLGARQRFAVDTTIDIQEHDGGSCSEVYVTTKDRPGLLVDIVAVLKDLNVNVVSAEVDTVGTEAQDEFFVTYQGAALSPSMQELVQNCLQYYLSLQEIESQESY